MWNIPLASSAHCSGHVPSWLLVCLLTGRAQGTVKNPWLSVSIAQHQLKHQRVINIILMLNPNHHFYKKMNSVTTETRIGDKSYMRFTLGLLLSMAGGSGWSRSTAGVLRRLPAADRVPGGLSARHYQSYRLDAHQLFVQAH